MALNPIWGTINPLPQWEWGNEVILPYPTILKLCFKSLNTEVNVYMEICMYNERTRISPQIRIPIRYIFKVPGSNSTPPEPENVGFRVIY
jgi:hypothetical protein